MDYDRSIVSNILRSKILPYRILNSNTSKESLRMSVFDGGLLSEIINELGSPSKRRLIMSG